MTTVHKFPLAAIPDVELMMPAGARLLHVGHQDGALMLWAEVDEQAPAERRQFVVVGTGWGKPADAEVYVGTVQAPNGLVWHVFEVAPLPVPEVGEERQAMIDQLRDQAIELDMLREALGVPYEPHQSLLERMLEAARGRAGSGAAPEPPAQQPMTPAAIDVLAERRRQVEAEGWTPEHDDEHVRGEIALAAACYALSAVGVRGGDDAQLRFWPWDDDWWRPSTPRRDLIKAGALILAEIERLDRAGIGKGESNEG